MTTASLEPLCPLAGRRIGETKTSPAVKHLSLCPLCVALWGGAICSLCLWDARGLNRALWPPRLWGFVTCQSNSKIDLPVALQGLL